MFRQKGKFYFSLLPLRSAFWFCPPSFSVHIYGSLYDTIIPANLLSVRKLLWNIEMIKVYSRSESSLHINEATPSPPATTCICCFSGFVWREGLRSLQRVPAASFAQSGWQGSHLLQHGGWTECSLGVLWVLKSKKREERQGRSSGMDWALPTSQLLLGLCVLTNIQSLGSEFSVDMSMASWRGLRRHGWGRGAAACSAPFPRQVSLLLTSSGYQGRSWQKRVAARGLCNQIHWSQIQATLSAYSGIGQMIKPLENSVSLSVLSHGHYKG